jgi:hypothetical protein
MNSGTHTSMDKYSASYLRIRLPSHNVFCIGTCTEVKVSQITPYVHFSGMMWKSSILLCEVMVSGRDVLLSCKQNIFNSVMQEEMSKYEGLEYVKSDLVKSKGIVYVKFRFASSALKAKEDIENNNYMVRVHSHLVYLSVTFVSLQLCWLLLCHSLMLIREVFNKCTQAGGQRLQLLIASKDCSECFMLACDARPCP